MTSNAMIEGTTVGTMLDRLLKTRKVVIVVILDQDPDQMMVIDLTRTMAGDLTQTMAGDLTQMMAIMVPTTQMR